MKHQPSLIIGNNVTIKKPRRKATIVVKRQYTGSRDMEKTFTEVFTRALIKLPNIETIPCVSISLT